MAGFVLPTFNLQVGIWRNGSHLYNPPDVTSTGNLSPGRITSVVQPEGAAVVIGEGGMWLRLPKGTDIRDTKAPAGADTVDCPLGSQRFYTVAFVDDIGFGFANEHRFAVIQAFGPWPVPFPFGGSPNPPPLPFPPSNLGNFTTGGVPQPSITYAVTVPSAGHAFVIVQWGGSSAFAPTVNGATPIAGTQQTYGTAGNTHNFAVWYFSVAAGTFNVNVVMAAGHNAALSGYTLFENYLTVPPQTGSLATGTGTQPTITTAINPFGAALKLILATFGTYNPPGGYAPVAAYTLCGSQADVIGGITFLVQTSAAPGPFTGGLPNWAENPAAGPWNAWAGHEIVGS